MKKCKACGEEKALSEFYRSGRYYRGTCKECHKKWQRTYAENGRASDPEWKHRRRQSAYLNTYGITVSEYNTMLTEQGGRCSICGSEDPKGRRGADHFHVDHDHATGKVRGLLCSPCNLGLGKFGDSIENLLAAADYLKRAQS